MEVLGTGSDPIHFGTPQSGHTYKYQIQYSRSDNNYYYFTIRIWEGSTLKHADTYPCTRNAPIKLSAFVETTTDAIDIDWSHFKQLRYLGTVYWNLWDDHSEHEIPSGSDYYLIPVSDYEFYAFKED